MGTHLALKAVCVCVVVISLQTLSPSPFFKGPGLRQNGEDRKSLVQKGA